MDALLMLSSDLAAELGAGVRLQRLVVGLRAHFGCDAVALLQLDGDALRPVAVDGLTGDVLGRRFVLKDHPRLAAIVGRQGATHFHHDDVLPDPYDGLVDTQVGAPLPVHDCMGIALQVEGRPWGALTFDALKVGTFGARAQAELTRFRGLFEASVRMTRLEAEVRALRMARSEPAAAGDAGDAGGGEIVGQSEAVVQLLHELGVVADSELPVLLLGETGVGKELFAHRLHRLSRRRERPLVHVNCAALPESLAESELFGHAKGAFSGALSERPGRFEAAHGGTLFLDEVGELPLSVQAKLLRTLQNGEIQRLGADRPRKVDVRVIAATNRDLRQQVRDGAFRADLYHRLSVYPVPIPPLRDRGRDVLLLAGRFLEANRGRLGLRSLRLSPAAQEALLRYPWPGNVRELEHVVSRAALRAVSRGATRVDIVTLEPELLDLDLDAGTPAAAAPAASGGAAAAAVALPSAPLRESVRACQRGAIEAALQRCGNNWSLAARALQVDASNLHKLAKRLGIGTVAAGRRG